MEASAAAAAAQLEAMCPATDEAALTILMRHPQLTADPKLLCSAARVCSSWRAAVAAGGAGMTDVAVNLVTAAHPEQSQESWSAFGIAWLPQHNQYVRSIKLAAVSQHHNTCNDAKIAASTHKVCAALSSGMQLATGAAEACSAPVRLQDYSADYVTYQLVAALPDSLTRLHLDWDAVTTADDTDYHDRVVLAVNRYLPRLKLLRDLRLTDVNPGLAEPAKTDCCLYLAGLAGLQHLTRLELKIYLAVDGCQALQGAIPSLQHVQVLALNFMPSSGHVAQSLDLSALTAATQLELTLAHGFNGAGTVLPPNLVGLDLFLRDRCGGTWVVPNPADSLSLWSLQQLRQLNISCWYNAISDYNGFLASLQEMTWLGSLSLSYGSSAAAKDESRLWRDLPKLSVLKLVDEDEYFEEATGSALRDSVLPRLARCTQLTQLVMIFAYVEEGAYDAYERQPLGRSLCHLSGLTNLQHLALRMPAAKFKLAAAMPLCSLQKLTYLQLSGMGRAVDDTVGQRIVEQLVQLRELDLSNSEFENLAAAARFFMLPHLTRFRLPEWGFGLHQA